MPAPILLIDGNNLAHYLYPDIRPDQPLQLAHYWRLIQHLSSYYRSHKGQTRLELCFDRTRYEADLPRWVNDHFQLLFPLPRKKADHVILERLSYHQYSGHACLVISNDERLRDRVEKRNGQAMPVHQFVRRTGVRNPVFRAPEELPPVDIPNKTEFEGETAARLIHTPTLLQRPIKQRPAQGFQILPAAAPQPILAETTPPPQTTLAAPEVPSAAESSDPRYVLTIDRWPREQALDLLHKAFCKQHARQHQELIGLMVDMGEVQELADLLAATCGSEPGFARQGALKKRVCLALLGAQRTPLSIPEIARLTGLNPLGLQGRIRQKLALWVGCRSSADEPSQ